MKCSKCGNEAVTFIRYNGTHLCREHFIEYVEKRVRKDTRKQDIRKGIVAVALSGGKDSLTALYTMNDIIRKHRNKELHAITVDEGIAGYRQKTIKVAQKHCERLGVEHHIISFEETIGYAVDEISYMREDLGECTYCGVFRRMCLNKKGREINAKSIVMGHNLDDVAQSVLMNFVNNDMERMARFAPHRKVQPGLIPRILPLRVIPEKETTLYALLKGIDVIEDKCPYSVRASRGTFRDIIARLEHEYPGTRHSVLNSYLTIANYLQEQYPPAKLNPCLKCREPTSQKICRACILREKLEAWDG
ncbi:MAG: TIGR00269 family protein [Candidatus Thermoplasmatota archaeon]|nr:TIGR00269 family protein [Candidatus Thermoplasmatota archaeon]